eukprot:m51a1_g2120 hypothetical protein (345) ;mRNA; r:1665905-1666939
MGQAIIVPLIIGGAGAAAHEIARDRREEAEADARRKCEAVEAARKAEIARQAEAAQAAEQARQAEAERAAEQARQRAAQQAAARQLAEEEAARAAALEAEQRAQAEAAAAELLRARERAEELVREAAANPIAAGAAREGAAARPQWLVPGRFGVFLCGPRGVGKSTLINSVRGLRDGDLGAAATDSVECTAEPAAYPHGAVVLYDLPGISSHVPRETYVNRMGLRWADVVVVVTGAGLGQDEVEIVRLLEDAHIPWFLVRSKLDAAADARRAAGNDNASSGPGAQVRATHARLWETLVAQLRQHIPSASADRVFVVSGWDSAAGGWGLLWSAIEHCASTHQPQC